MFFGGVYNFCTFYGEIFESVFVVRKNYSKKFT